MSSNRSLLGSVWRPSDDENRRPQDSDSSNWSRWIWNHEYYLGWSPSCCYIDTCRRLHFSFYCLSYGWTISFQRSSFPFLYIWIGLDNLISLSDPSSHVLPLISYQRSVSRRISRNGRSLVDRKSKDGSSTCQHLLAFSLRSLWIFCTHGLLLQASLWANQRSFCFDTLYCRLHLSNTLINHLR